METTGFLNYSRSPNLPIQKEQADKRGYLLEYIPSSSLYIYFGMSTFDYLKTELVLVSYSILGKKYFFKLNFFLKLTF